MPTEPEVTVQGSSQGAAPSEVRVVTTATVDPGQLSELSKRVDQTHTLVVRLDGRFETHRAHMDERMATVMDGISEIREAQARASGAEEASDDDRERQQVRRNQGLQFRSNVIGILSVFATIGSIVAVLISTTSSTPHR